MKKQLFTLVFIIALAITGTQAQLKIGDNPLVIDPDAILHMEVTAQNKGVLLPRVTTATRPAADATNAGMIVYNTTTGTTQYCNGTVWQDLATGSGNWTLTGNPSTNPATNFLGTTDAQPLVLRTSNAEAMRITSDGNIGIGVTNPAATLHVRKSAASGTQFAQYIEGVNAGANYLIGLQVATTQNAAGSFNTYGINSNPVYSATGNHTGIIMGIQANPVVNSATGTLANLYGLYSVPALLGASNISTMVGLSSFPTINTGATGNVTATYGINTGANNLGTGVVNTHFGIVINNPVGNITNRYALVTGSNAGNVGIGTSAPQAPLHVALSVANTFSFGQWNGFNFGSGADLADSPTGGVSASMSAYFAGDVWTSGTYFSAQNITFSDARIKDIKGLSNRNEDLALLNQIRITDYTMKDRVRYGDKAFKKVIAQELETVYPQAVEQTSNYIPNIYSLAKNVAINGSTVTLTTDKAHDLKAGDRVRLYNEANTEMDVSITAATDHTFTVTIEKPETKYFIYGKQVHDFRTVDYEALSMLNISATQELARKVEALERENAELKATAAKITILEQEMASIKALLQKPATTEKTETTTEKK